MIKEQRFEFILNKIKTDQQVTYEQIAGSLNVSEDTVRRDIDQLYRNGLVSKIRGGAMLPSRNPLTFQDRNNILLEQKDIIVAKALGFIKEGMTVFMDGGTTICALAGRLPSDINIRIITNNIPAIQLLVNYPDIELIVLGGVYERNSATNTGTVTCLDLERYTADLYLMGTCGVDDKFGVTATIESDAHVKRAMLRRSKKTVSLANQKILHQTEAFRVCDFQDLHAMITNMDSNHADLDGFRNLGVQII